MNGCLGARPRYSLAVDEDVEKPTNQPNKQTNRHGWSGELLLLSVLCLSHPCVHQFNLMGRDNLCSSLSLYQAGVDSWTVVTGDVHIRLKKVLKAVMVLLESFPGIPCKFYVQHAM